MELTKLNYYTRENKYLSNSKFKDWLIDKKYFYSKYILGKIHEKNTRSMDIGLAVDTYVFEGKIGFLNRFIGVAKRGKKEDSKIELTDSDYEKSVAMAETLPTLPVTKKLKKNFIAQEILFKNEDLGHFVGLCGIPDWYKIERGKAIIVDLKTCQTLSAYQYNRHCLEFGYYNQQAFYQMLLADKYKINKFESRHLSISKEEVGGRYQTEMFVLSQNKIEEQKEFILKELSLIKKEKKWNIRKASWKNPVILYDFL